MLLLLESKAPRSTAPGSFHATVAERLGLSVIHDASTADLVDLCLDMDGNQRGYEHAHSAASTMCALVPQDYQHMAAAAAAQIIDAFSASTQAGSLCHCPIPRCSSMHTPCQRLCIHGHGNRSTRHATMDNGCTLSSCGAGAATLAASAVADAVPHKPPPLQSRTCTLTPSTRTHTHTHTIHTHFTHTYITTGTLEGAHSPQRNTPI